MQKPPTGALPGLPPGGRNNFNLDELIRRGTGGNQGSGRR
jgi:hypothetical protein